MRRDRKRRKKGKYEETEKAQKKMFRHREIERNETPEAHYCTNEEQEERSIESVDGFCTLARFLVTKINQKLQRFHVKSK